MRRARWMLVFWSVVLPAQPAEQPPLTAQQIFDRVREHVRQQLTRTANYTCVETIDRSYENAVGARSDGCAARASLLTKKPFMHDKLRLDVAASQGEEIFSWHGGDRFASNGITELVQSGPISSGSFVGYLQNIFFQPGVSIRHLEKRSPEGWEQFDYNVPLAASRQYVSVGRGKEQAPFSGSFFVDPASLDLTRLIATIDKAPKRSEICYANSTVDYQTVSISGVDSRIPKRFTLEVDDATHLFTTSRSEYAQCRAFRGESTITFKVDEGGSIGNQAAQVDEPLPAGLTLPVNLNTVVDDVHWFAGDPVEGTLTKVVKLPHGTGLLAKGSKLTGFITRLESRYQPSNHELLAIRFHRLIDGPNSYVFDSEIAASRAATDNLTRVYGFPLPPYVRNTMTSGLLVWIGSHFSTNGHLVADWKTLPLTAEEKR